MPAPASRTIRHFDHNFARIAMSKIRLIGALVLTLLSGAVATPAAFGTTANSHTSVATHSPANAAPTTVDAPRSPTSTVQGISVPDPGPYVSPVAPESDR